MHAEADEQENDCLVLEASDINEQTAELANDDCTSARLLWESKPTISTKNWL